MDPIVFRSRIDPLLAGLVIIPLLLAVALVAQRAVARGQRPDTIVLATLVGSLALVAWIGATTAYRLTERELLVTSGPVRVRVPLVEIQRITRTRSVLSALALSLDRLEVTYGTGRAIVISPKDQTAFFRAVAARAPQAQLPAGT